MLISKIAVPLSNVFFHVVASFGEWRLYARCVFALAVVVVKGRFDIPPRRTVYGETID